MRFIARYGGFSCEFEVIAGFPEAYGIITSNTELFFEGEPINIFNADLFK